VICNIANVAFQGTGKIDLMNGDMRITITNAVESKNGLYSENLLRVFGTSIQRKSDDVIGVAHIRLAGTNITSPIEFEKECFSKFIQCTALVETLIQSLWFSKDNSASVTGSYCEIEAINFVNGKGASVVNYTSNGKVEVIRIGPEDIAIANEVHTALSKIMPQREHRMFDELPSIMSELNGQNKINQVILSKTPLNYDHNDYNRIERALMFLQIARNNSYLPYRLAFFVPILECLFGDVGNKSDITHKVAERVAFYVGKSSADRYDCYTNVKDAYAIRSKFIHGDIFEKASLRKVDLLSPKIEEITRLALKKIITTDSNRFIDDAKRAEFLKNIVFQIYSE